MENKTNIAELLKDCPRGMELDCTMYENLYFDYISNSEYSKIYPIRCYTEDDMKAKYPITFTLYGRPSQHDSAKCVIFPKGKTTWEGFHKPFEDGDIVAHDGPHLEISIFKDKKENNTLSDCYLMLDGDELFLEDGMYYVTRFATEEERQKLFDAIKSHGYKWNPETKTLETLPKFKVGDRIKHKVNTIWVCTIKRVTDRYYVYGHPTCYTLPFDKQDEYELVPQKFDINTLRPFESRVLVRHNKDNKWCGSFFSHIDGDFHSHCYKFVTIAGKSYPMCIPYEGNEYLLGTTNDCREYFKTW